MSADATDHVQREKAGERRATPRNVELVYQSDVNSVLAMLATAVKEDATVGSISHNYSFYHAALDRIDLLMTQKDSPITKSHILAILRQLAYFRPKKIERAQKLNHAYGERTNREIIDDQVSLRHKELMKSKADKFQTMPSHLVSFLYKNLQKGLLKDIMNDWDENQEDKMQEGLYEVLAIYIQVYQNLEVRINDMINGKRLNSVQALDVLSSFAIAEEGTNTLFLGLIDLVARRDVNQEPYTTVEIEMILNYFPHSIWYDADQMQQEGGGDLGSLRTRFYQPLLQQLDSFWDVLTNEELLAIF